MGYGVPGVGSVAMLVLLGLGGPVRADVASPTPAIEVAGALPQKGKISLTELKKLG
jgi:hypothetical protein